MDSLLANYASSDEEEHEEHQAPSKPEGKGEHISSSSSKPAGIFNSLPPPKTSLFNSLPPPKSQSLPKPNPKQVLEQRREEFDERDEEVLENPKPNSSASLFSKLPPPKSSPASSLFSSLPQPKSSAAATAASSSNSKRVVQFRPPTMLNPQPRGINVEDEDDDEDEKERQRKRSKESLSTSSAASFLSSIPAPKHSATLGALPSALGTGRRSMIETASPAPTGIMIRGAGIEAVERSGDDSSQRVGSENHEDTYDVGRTGTEGGVLSSSDVGYYSRYASGNDAASSVGMVVNDDGVNSSMGSAGGQSVEMNYDYSGGSSGTEYYSSYGGEHGVHVGSQAVDYSYGNDQPVEYANTGGSYGGYDSNAHYENNWADATALPEVSGLIGNAIQMPRKKGRKDAPPEIIEVKQDELMKNRPREDQVKVTGIAFGPSYQPAPTKGKPSKLHKRKHQIGSLYFDMRQKEMELAERRAQGFKTKAETQSKYGW